MRLIDADALTAHLHDTTFVDGDDRSIVYRVIDTEITIDPVKHGKWKPHPTEPDWDACSVCASLIRRRFHYNDTVYGVYDIEESFAYCPHCGARMDGKE